MSNSKISALTFATTVAGSEVLPIVQSSATVKVSIANLTPGLSTITAAKGGTGQASYAVGDLLYADTTTTLAKLADVATGNALISGGIGVAPSWGKIGLTTHVSGVLPVANGGTNASTASITSFNNITGYSASGATGTTTTNLVFSTNPSITTPTLVGDVTLSNGNITQGTAAKGINFTANTPAAGMTSQLLNWYEEGTFTPTYTPATGAFTSISVVSSGRYRRIGSAVFFSIDIRTNAVIIPGTASGILYITGLPFTSGANGGYGMCSIFQQFNLSTSFTSLGLLVEASQSRLYLTKNSSNAGVTYVQASELLITGGSFDNLIGLSGMYTI
jgi:hypothetical protein